MPSVVSHTNNEVPTKFLCPITRQIMREPLMCKNGCTFEREAILEWLKDHSSTCPLTRQELSLRDLVPNWKLKAEIKLWIDENLKSEGIVQMSDDEDNKNGNGACECDILFMLNSSLLPTKMKPITATGQSSPQRQQRQRQSRRRDFSFLRMALKH